MKLNKKLVLAAVALPLTLSSASVYAFGANEHQGEKYRKCGSEIGLKIMRKLDLTDAQKKQLKDMRTANKAQIKAKTIEHFQAMQAQKQEQTAQIQQLVLADTFDQAAATQLAKTMVEQQVERKVKKLKRDHQMLSILTKEQKAKFIQLSKERAEKCAKKMQQRFAEIRQPE